jgi:zinc/manganese transport system substrate-binding protein
MRSENQEPTAGTSLRVRAGLRVGALCALVLGLLVLPMRAQSLPSFDAGGVGDRLQVVTTIPDLADLTEIIGGDLVEVTTLCRGRENIHAVPTRPSAIVALNRADLVIEVGLSLEHAFLPPLLMAARNPDIRTGSPGFLNVSGEFPVIQVPPVLDRGQSADIHPQGNPHINLDPRAGKHFARAIHARLVELLPDHRKELDANKKGFLEALEKKQKEWAKLRERIAGLKLVTFHRDLDYFMLACDAQLVGTVEVLPGVPATPTHIAELTQKMADHGCKHIVCAGWSNNRWVRKLAKSSGAEVIEVPVMVNGVEGVESWIGLMDHLHTTLAALAPEPPPEERVDG